MAEQHNQSTAQQRMQQQKQRASCQPDALQYWTRHERLQRIQTWAVTLLSGVLCAVMAFLINLGIEGIDKLRFKATLHLIKPQGGLFLPWLAFVSTSCASCLLAGLGVAYLSPLAAGSGIPHIMAYCNGVDIPGLLTFKTLVVKALGAMCSIGAGLVAGKEGPFIQCGACIAWILASWMSRLTTTSSSSSRNKVPAPLPSDNSSNVLLAANTDCSTSTSKGQQGVLPQAPQEAQRGSQQPEEQQQCHSSWEQQQQQQPYPQQHQQQQRSEKQQEQERHEQQERLRLARLERRCRLHDAAAMGAGAGVAAAFVAPLAGSAYAVEDIAARYSSMILGTAFFTGGVMVLFLWIFTTAASAGGSSLRSIAFTTPLALAFHGTATNSGARFWWYVWEVPVVMLLGALAGGIGALWTVSNTRLLLLRARLTRHPLAKVADLLLVCLITNTIRLVVSYGSACKVAPSAAQLTALEAQVTSWQFVDSPTGLYPQLWCPEGHYSVYGQLFMMPVEVVVKSLFTFQPNDLPDNAGAWPHSSAGAPQTASGGLFVMEPACLVAYMAFGFAMLLITYGVSAPTGIFIPSLVIGAAGGRLVGQLIQVGLHSSGSMLRVCLPGWSVLGAAGMLVGTTRLTLSNALIVLESSGAVPMSVPLVLLIVPAKLVADSIFPGIYQWQIRQAQYVFLEALDNLSSKERAAATHFKVQDLLQGQSQPHASEAGRTSAAAAATAGAAGKGNDQPQRSQSTLTQQTTAAAGAGDIEAGLETQQQQDRLHLAARQLPVEMQDSHQDRAAAADAGAAGSAADTHTAVPLNNSTGVDAATAAPAPTAAAAAAAAAAARVAAVGVCVTPQASIIDAHAIMKMMQLDCLPVLDSLASNMQLGQLRQLQQVQAGSHCSMPAKDADVCAADITHVGSAVHGADVQQRAPAVVYGVLHQQTTGTLWEPLPLVMQQQQQGCRPEQQQQQQQQALPRAIIHHQQQQQQPGVTQEQQQQQMLRLRQSSSAPTAAAGTCVEMYQRLTRQDVMVEAIMEAVCGRQDQQHAKLD